MPFLTLTISYLRSAPYRKHTKNLSLSMVFEGLGVSQKGLGRVFGGSWGWFRGLWVDLVRLGVPWGGLEGS